MLRLESVTYRYAGAPEPSLRDVSLEVLAGEVVGVVGASGSGKSTLCLVAGGLAPRVVRGRLEGRLRIGDQDMSGRPMHELAALVATGFGDPRTQLSTVCETVYEEVAFGPSNLGLPSDAVLERVEDALERLGIGDLAERHPSTLSGGQQQLVVLGGLLAMRPRCLVLDEPTAQLDPMGARMVMDVVMGLAATGAAVLMTEQRVDELARACARVVALEHGRVALQGTAHEVLRDGLLCGLGVAEPAPVRLARLVREAGLDPAVVPVDA